MAPPEAKPAAETSPPRAENATAAEKGRADAGGSLPPPASSTAPAAPTPEAVRKSFALTGLWADDEEDEEDEEAQQAAGARGLPYGRSGSAASASPRPLEPEPEATPRKVRGRGSVRHPGSATRGAGGYGCESAWDDDRRDAPAGRVWEGGRRC